MIQEDKELLIKDLSARLPYGVEITWNGVNPITISPGIYSAIWLEQDYRWKAYLRPMSSMTKEEKDEFERLMNLVEERCINAYGNGGYTLAFTKLTDYLNAHFFDYRGLIERGLALKALDGMYKQN